MQLYNDSNIIEFNKDDKIYYYKKVNYYSLINELLGCFYSNIINLDSVNYQIGINNNELYALSKSFILPNYNYKTTLDIYKSTIFDSINLLDYIIKINYYKTSILDNIEDSILKDNLCKLIALDLKMNQQDRHVNNILFKEDICTKDIFLAPIYDYEISYMLSNKFIKIYGNPLILFKTNKTTLDSIFNKYPKIKEYLIKLLDIDIYDALKYIENIHNIKLDIKEYRLYSNEDKRINKILKRSL